MQELFLSAGTSPTKRASFDAKEAGKREAQKLIKIIMTEAEVVVGGGGRGAWNMCARKKASGIDL